MSNEKIKGVIVAFYAPYNEKGSLCPEMAIRLAQYYADAGVDGLYLNGSSGEGLLLSAAERRLLAEAVIPSFRDKLAMIVHVGAASTRESIELTVHAEKAGAHAVAALPSVYYRVCEEEIFCHWASIAAATRLPFYIYNIPSTTGYHLSSSLFRRTVENGLVRGIKDSSRDVAQLEIWRSLGGKNFTIINGADDQYLAGRMMQADAGIGGTYGVMAELFVMLENGINNGQIEQARDIQCAVNGFIRRIKEISGGRSFIGACKKVLARRGFETGGVRQPLLDPPDSSYDIIDRLARDIDIYAGSLILNRGI